MFSSTRHFRKANRLRWYADELITEAHAHQLAGNTEEHDRLIERATGFISKSVLARRRGIKAAMRRKKFR